MDNNGRQDQNLNQTQAATDAHVSHEQTLFAEPLFQIGNFTATNSLVNSWLVLVVIVILSLWLRRRISLVPGQLQNGFETLVDGFLGIFDSVTGSRARSLKYFPLVFAFFIFILLSNWMGLLPGIGSIGQIVEHDGHALFVPYFRSGTADLNTTLALAIIGVVVSHIFGVAAIGAWKHLNKFINLEAIIEIPKKVRQDPAVLLVNPIKLFVGLVELIGEAAKLLSLSFRLFGNVFAGEILLASISAILAFGLPLPFMFLEVIVGLVQATIFSMLILDYLTINTSAEEH